MKPVDESTLATIEGKVRNGIEVLPHNVAMLVEKYREAAAAVEIAERMSSVLGSILSDDFVSFDAADEGEKVLGEWEAMNKADET